jgi:hypothetical protein
MDESQWTWPPTTLGELTELLALAVVLAALCLRVLPATRRWAPRGHGGVAPTARTGRAPAGRSFGFSSHPSH